MKYRFLTSLLFAFAATSSLFAVQEVAEITDGNFFQKVILSKKPMILTFYGEHCKPCNQLKPIFSELNEKYGDEVQFARVNVAAQRDMASQFGVKGIPTIVFLKPDTPWPKIVKTKVGLMSKQALDDEIAQFR